MPGSAVRLDSALLTQFEAGFAQAPESDHFRVGYSGGADSLALLLLARQLFPRSTVSALHVHHGLHCAADEWSQLCRDNCANLDVAFTEVRVCVDTQAPCGLEAAARTARYAAFTGQLCAGECILLAHHQDDQAETLLLRLLRGAGPDGLCGMPAQRKLGHGVLWRPLLDTPRAVLHQLAEASGLPWVEDPSNLGKDCDRGYLRSAVLQSVAARWPGYRDTLSRAAGHCRDETSARDVLLQPLLDAAVDGEGCLRLEALDKLPPEVARLLLRAWLKRTGNPLPDTRELDNLLQVMGSGRSDAAPQARCAGVLVRRFRGRLHALQSDAGLPADYAVQWNPCQELVLPCALGRLRLAPRHAVPRNWQFTVISRREGLRFRAHQNGPSKSLKHWFQERKVPPWERGQIPLLMRDNELLAVGDRWLTDRFQAELEETGVGLFWDRHAGDAITADPRSKGRM